MSRQFTHSFAFFLLSLLFLFSRETLADSNGSPTTQPAVPAGIDVQPLNASQPLETWVLSRKFSWSNSEHIAYQVGNESNTINFKLDEKEKFFLSMYKLNVKSSEGNFHVRPNTHHEWCKISQTYKMSNGVQFYLDVRGLRPDRWYIKKSGNIDQKYTYYRYAHSNEGYVKSKNHQHVAHFGTETLGSEDLSKLIHSKIPGTTISRIVSNGQVPILELATLFVISILRVDSCKW